MSNRHRRRIERQRRAKMGPNGVTKCESCGKPLAMVSDLCPQSAIHAAMARSGSPNGNGPQGPMFSAVELCQRLELLARQAQAMSAKAAAEAAQAVLDDEHVKAKELSKKALIHQGEAQGFSVVLQGMQRAVLQAQGLEVCSPCNGSGKLQVAPDAQPVDCDFCHGRGVVPVQPKTEEKPVEVQA